MQNGNNRKFIRKNLIMENGDKIQFTKDIATLTSEMEFVKLQVSNHIPTSIREMSMENKEEHKALRASIDKIKNKLAVWSGAITVIIVAAQIIISKFF